MKQEQQAEDVVQETFLQAFASIKTYKFNLPFEAWLKRIAINKSIDYWRKNQRTLEQASQWQQEQVEEEQEEQEENNEVMEWHIEHLKQAISTLNDSQRIAISLFYFEEYSHEEVAKLMNISVGNSRILVLRAKQKLKSLLLNMNGTNPLSND